MYILTTNRGRFRVRSQRVLLTYSQIKDDFDKEGLGAFLEEKLPQSDCIAIELERHQDGGLHIHAYFDAGPTGLAVNDPKHFDWSGHHPNITPIKVTPYKAYEYAIKDGGNPKGADQRGCPSREDSTS